MIHWKWLVFALFVSNAITWIVGGALHRANNQNELDDRYRTGYAQGWRDASVRFWMGMKRKPRDTAA